MPWPSIIYQPFTRGAATTCLRGGSSSNMAEERKAGGGEVAVHSLMDSGGGNRVPRRSLLREGRAAIVDQAPEVLDSSSLRAVRQSSSLAPPCPCKTCQMFFGGPLLVFSFFKLNLIFQEGDLHTMGDMKY